MRERDAATGERTNSVRTERESRCVQDAHTADASGVQRGAVGSAVDSLAADFVRTEQTPPSARASRPPLAPAGSARLAVADQLDVLVQARWDAGDAWASNRALARTCVVDEKIIRQWRDARKSLPVSALLVLPPTLVHELVTWVQDERALTPHRRGVPMLTEALDRLDAPVARDDRDEVMRSLIDAQRRISERIARLATEGR